MYGTKRITISNKGLIAIEGNKSHVPVGRMYFVASEQKYVGRIKDGSNMYATSLDDSNSIEFKLNSKAEIKELVKSKLC